MPGSTPIYGFPYPDPSDLVANYPALGQQLAEDIEDVLPTLGGLAPATPTTIANSGGTATLSGNTVTFTGVSSVSLNGCFSGDYDNYVLVVAGTNTGVNRLFLRMRASGSEASGATDYKVAGFYSDTSPASGAIDNSTGTSSANIGFLAGGGGSSVDIYSPFIAAVSKMRSNCMYKA